MPGRPSLLGLVCFPVTRPFGVVGDKVSGHLRFSAAAGCPDQIGAARPWQAPPETRASEQKCWREVRALQPHLVILARTGPRPPGGVAWPPPSFAAAAGPAPRRRPACRRTRHG
jgi:hypothetical protein